MPANQADHACRSFHQLPEIMNFTRNLIGALICLTFLVSGASAETEVNESPQTNIQAQEFAKLEKMVRNQEDRVEACRKHLAILCSEKRVVYHPGSIGDGTSPLTDRANHLAMKRAEIECERIMVASQVEAIGNYDGEQLCTLAVSSNLPDNPIKTLYPKLLEARRELTAMMHSGRGANDPAVQQQVQRVEGLTKDLNEGVEAVRFTLQARLQILTAQEKQLGMELEALQNAVVDRGLELMDVDNAWRTYEVERARFERLKDTLANQVVGD